MYLWVPGEAGGGEETGVGHREMCEMSYPRPVGGDQTQAAMVHHTLYSIVYITDSSLRAASQTENISQLSITYTNNYNLIMKQNIKRSLCKLSVFVEYGLQDMALN